MLETSRIFKAEFDKMLRNIQAEGQKIASNTKVCVAIKMTLEEIVEEIMMMILIMVIIAILIVIIKLDYHDKRS